MGRNKNERTPMADRPPISTESARTPDHGDDAAEDLVAESENLRERRRVEQDEPVRVRSGQVWKRKSDGVLTTVISVSPPTYANRRVLHQARRRTWTELGPFLRKYELVQGPHTRCPED